MISFLNFGPPRCGSTSLYDFLIENPYIHAGVKEPLHTGYKLSRTLEYVLEKNFKGSKGILMDASPRLIYLDDARHMRKYLYYYTDEYKFILLIRKPSEYYRTRLYMNYYMKVLCGFEPDSSVPTYNNVKNVPDLNKVDLQDIEDLDLDDVEQYIDNWRDLRSCSFCEYLLDALTVFKESEIFILPIDRFEKYRGDLFDFLNVDDIGNKFPHSNKSIKSDIKLLKLYSAIKKKIDESRYFKLWMENDLIAIDNMLGTKLYAEYYR